MVAELPESAEEGTSGPPVSETPPPAAVPRGTRRQRRKGMGGGRKRGKNFLDVADQAFFHQMAVSIWRDAEALLEASPSFEEGMRQLREFCEFEDRGQFAAIWRKNWLAALSKISASSSQAERLEAIRASALKSIEEEGKEREAAGLPPLIDEKEGFRFVTFAVNRILEEAEGEIEEDL